MPKYNQLPPLEKLHELLKVVEIPEEKYGIWSGLIWKTDRRGKMKAGNVAGTLSPHPLKQGRFDWKVKICGKLYIAARIIFYMSNNINPGDIQVDHKDTNTMNNNVLNLRLDSDDGSLQKHNQSKRLDNKSGVPGVTWHKQRKKWRAVITHKHQLHCLGLYVCKIEAARAINDKIIELDLDKIGKPLNNLKQIKCDCKNHVQT